MTHPSHPAAKAGRFLLRYLYALGCCLYAFTIGLFRNRVLIYQVCEYFGWPAPDWLNRPVPLLPEVPAGEVVSGDVQITVIEERANGNTSLLESVVINKLVKQGRARRVFEIGTFDGKTTLAMAANSGDGSRVFTLDLPASGLGSTKFAVCDNDKQYIDKTQSGASFTQTKYRQKITQLFGDSATFDFSAYHGTMDLVFIDGSHAHDYVVNDSETALKLLGPAGGTVLWHDYDSWDGVTDALNDFYRNDRRFRGLKRVRGTSLVVLQVGERVGTAAREEETASGAGVPALNGM